MKRVLAAILALMLLSSWGTALAIGSVSYVGGAEKFVFLPGSKYEDTDMFEGFKGLMPGDSRQQTITLTNDSERKVRIYMRADPVDEDDRDFLQHLNLRIQVRNKEIFDADADERAQLTEPVLLGTFRTKGSTELTVTVDVPFDLDPVYMGREGTVIWTFMVEYVDDDDDSPETGDLFDTVLWCSIALMLTGTLILLLFLKKRKEHTND